jgi:succinyl-CoA synthetase beta subunit
VPFGESRAVQSSDEAVAAAAEIGYPVVLKSLAALHKSDAGGVVLGLGDETALSEAVARLAAPELAVEHQEDTSAGFELLVGARRDPRFGPVVLVGAGGVRAEVIADTALALAPVDEQQAACLLRSLRCAPLLDGVEAAARAVVALSRFAAAHPEVAEVEVNPLLVRASDVVGLDARVLLAR